MSATLPVLLDRDSAVPLYRQLAEQLTAGLRQGSLHPGDPFENEIEMARRLQVSRPTVRRAIAQLVAAGLLIRRRGIGTVVASGGIHRRAQLTSLYDDLSASQRAPGTSVLEFASGIRSDRACRALDLASETLFVHIVRLRHVGGLPLAILRNWLPVEVPGVDGLTPEVLEQQGLYAVLRAAGTAPTVARQRFGARNATGRERALLRSTRADPLLTMTRRAWTAHGLAVEFGDHCYRGELYSIDVTVHAQP